MHNIETLVFPVYLQILHLICNEILQKTEKKLKILNSIAVTHDTRKRN